MKGMNESSLVIELSFDSTAFAKEKPSAQNEDALKQAVNRQIQGRIINFGALGIEYYEGPFVDVRD